MSIDGINGTNQVRVNNQVRFTSNPTEAQTCNPETKDGDKSNLLWAGLAGLATIASVGVIYAVSRGKGSSKNITETVEKPVEQIKEMAIDAFKKVGNKLEKGKALTASGEGYTGTLTHTNKDGNKFVHEYKDGILQKTAKFNGEEQVSEKLYGYDKTGKLSDITEKSSFFDAEEKETVVNISKSNFIHSDKTGKLIKFRKAGNGFKNFYYSPDGKLKYMQHEYSENGITGVKKLTKYAQDGKKEFTILNDREVQLFDKSGQVADNLTIDLNRGGQSYTYKNLSYSNEIQVGGSEQKYTLSTDNNAGIVGLFKTDTPTYKCNNLVFTKEATPTYVIDLNTNTVSLNGEKTPLADKKLAESILKQGEKVKAQITSMHEKVMGIKSKLQEDLTEFGRARDHIIS